MLHGIAGDERAGSAEPRLAVHRQRALRGLCGMQKFLHYLHGGDAAVGEVQLVMRNAIFDEIAGLVGLVIQPHHGPHAQLLKDGRVVIGGEGPILDRVRKTPYLSMVLSEGELKATNLWGTIQFRSPFSIFS